MRRRALVGVTLLLALFGGLSAHAAYSTGELEWIAIHELIPEIRDAASIALADRYVDEYSLEQLQAIAGSVHEGIQEAAELSLRYLNDPLLPLLVDSSEDLAAEAETGATPQARLDAARAYYIKARETLTVEALEQDAAEASEERGLAAGEVLGGFYAAYGLKSEAQLMHQAVEGATAGLRRAATIALTSLWIESLRTLTDGQIEARILQFTLWRPGLAEAYAGVLLDRYREAGGPE